MAQEVGEKWTGEAVLQPTFLKSDRLLRVGLFALSLPMTRLAVGSAQAPQLSPEFVALSRAAVAGVLAAVWLVWQRAPLPDRRDWALLAAMALLHEVLDLTTLLFAGAVLAVVFVARRMPVHEAPHPVSGSRS